VPRNRTSKGTGLQPRSRVVYQQGTNATGGTYSDTTTYAPTPATRTNRKNRSLGKYNPATAGTQATSGIGALEAEFLVAIALLILLMFANGSESYSNRIMSVMKRGTLTCIAFFILALVASGGPNSAKIAKGLGALIIVSILVTSPITTVFKDIDNLIKNDWVGSSETEGGTNPASSNQGTNSSTTAGSPSSAAQSFIKSVETQLGEQGQKAVTGDNPLSKSNIKTDVQNALTSTLNGIIPGSGDVISKLFGG
jgi:hypothetical protein